MQLAFDKRLVEGYKSASQKIRVLTEHWVDKEIYCPNCGRINVNKYPSNKPATDFFCSNCQENYELKSKRNNIGMSVVDGAYRTMMESLRGNDNPNLFLLSYDLDSFKVLNFLVVPKHFFVPDIIERRKPLSLIARRAGWIGCNIILRDIPSAGKIFFVKNNFIEPKEKVLAEWKRTLFLREEKEISAKGWLLDVMRCIEKISKSEFTLNDAYSFEKELSRLHPENKHIKDKIRQQLQVLRDRGYLKFVSRGYYRRA